MPSSFNHTMSNLCYKFLDYCKISSSTSKADNVERSLPDNSSSLEKFCSDMQIKFILDASLGTESMELSTVSELRLCKESKTLSEHEYLAAKTHEPSGKSAFLCFERFRGDIVETTVGLARPWDESSKEECYPSVTTFVQHAKDVVTPLPDSGLRKETDEVCRTLSFHQAPLFLHELAALAHTFHENHDTYSLLFANCYFYTGTIVKILEEVYKPSVDPMVEATGVKPGSDKQPKQAGKWKFFDIYKQIDTRPFIEQFEREKEAFEQPILAKKDERRRHLDAAYMKGFYDAGTVGNAHAISDMNS